MASFDEQALLEGCVYKKSNGLYSVQAEGKTVSCELSSKLRKELVRGEKSGRVTSVREIQSVDPVAVGDRVMLIPPNGGNGLIVEVLPRRSKLSRPEAAFGKHAREQVIVANLDQVVAVMALAQPSPSWNLLDRYLVSAASLGLEAVIALTKADLAMADGESLAVAAEYRRQGYRVILTSTYTGEGLDELRAALRGKISAFIGKSGVGKSTLLNAIQPGLGLRVKAVSGLTSKGRHTTTHLELFPLDMGGAVADTPGTREFGLWQVDGANIAQFFPEARGPAQDCRFGLGCSHSREPGCGVRRAIAEGKITRRRYESMLKLAQETRGG